LPGVNYFSAPTGVGFFHRFPDAIVGDRVIVVGRTASCMTWTWGGGKPPTTFPCRPTTGQVQLRKVP
jgi:hypothetical protein